MIKLHTNLITVVLQLRGSKLHNFESWYTFFRVESSYMHTFKITSTVHMQITDQSWTLNI